MNQPTAIIVKDGMGRPVNPHPKWFQGQNGLPLSQSGIWEMFESEVKYNPCPSIANTEPGETILARLQWQYKPYDDKYFFIDCSDDLWELTVPIAFDTRQIWVPIVEQKEGEGKFGEWVSVKDRLPERKVWVIGYKEGQSKDDWTHPIDQLIMYYTGPGEWSGWMKDTGYTFTPSHWMPLPEKPNLP